MSADAPQHWRYVAVVARRRHAEASISPYKLAVVADALGGRAGVDPSTGELHVTVRVPGIFKAGTCDELARSLVRAAFYNAGIRGWILT